MAQVVYLLCGITSFFCALLLFRAHFRRPSQLLLWSAVCFLGLFLNNVLLFADLVLFPDVYLQPYRHLAALAGVALLIYGLIWDVV